MWRWLKTLGDRLFVVIGALIFSQIPLFIDHYQVELGARLTELELQVGLMRQAAHHSHKTLDQYVEKFKESQDPDFSRQGSIMAGMVQRWESLSVSLTALQNASLLERPLIFLKHLNGEIIQSTYKSFSFGLFFTVEVGIYALAGMLFGYLLFAGISRCFEKIIKRAPHVVT